MWNYGFLWLQPYFFFTSGNWKNIEAKQNWSCWVRPTSTKFKSKNKMLPSLSDIRSNFRAWWRGRRRAQRRPRRRRPRWTPSSRRIQSNRPKVSEVAPIHFAGWRKFFVEIGGWQGTWFDSPTVKIAYLIFRVLVQVSLPCLLSCILNSHRLPDTAYSVTVYAMHRGLVKTY